MVMDHSDCIGTELGVAVIVGGSSSAQGQIRLLMKILQTEANDVFVTGDIFANGPACNRERIFYHGSLHIIQRLVKFHVIPSFFGGLCFSYAAMFRS